TGPYWEAVGWEGGLCLSPPPRRQGLLGLSPSLLASPLPPGPPDEVVRDLFADVCLSPQVGTVTPTPPVSPSRCHLPTAGVAYPPPVVPSPPQGTRGSPRTSAVAPREAAATGRRVAPRGAAGTARGQRGQGAPPRPKKKCVNGFIMFCRLNRKSYMSAHPGLLSTTVTRELAQLWRSLSPDERRAY
ncbi:BHMG1 protein, partial [Alcedo cyanopectus]|nr:BHMG1 protein [Ceyx cyanopectus]